MMRSGFSQALLTRLAERVPRGGPAWLLALRRHAVSTLESHGLPTRKHEAWRFTSLRGVADRMFGAAPPPADPSASLSRVREQLGDDRTWRVALVNGWPCLEEAGAPPAGISAGVTPDLAIDEGPADHLGRLARVEHFSALNLALFEHALVLRVEPGAAVEQPIHIVHCSAPGAEPTAAYPRVLVMAEPGSQVTLIETSLTQGAPTGEAPHLTAAVTELAMGQGAHVDHVRVHHGAAHSHVIGTVAVRQERDSRYASRVVSLGGALCRLDLDVALVAEGAECRLDGAYHVTGGEHVDHHTAIDHQAPRCRSRESYRGILDGTGRAVFDGTIAVRRDAQRTSAHQENRNLLLSDDAVVNTKPHLTIDADDVSCSHGATIGALDDEQLFYLRTRGIDEHQARAILTYAFVREILDGVAHEPVARRVIAAMVARLPYGNTLREEQP